MKKLPIIFLCLSLLFLSACGTQTAGVPEESNDALRTVTDACGRQVALPKEVTSVVCVGVGALRYTVYLQAQDLIVGVESDEVGVQIVGHARPLPLVGVVAALLGPVDQAGNVELKVSVTRCARPGWVEGGYSDWTSRWGSA